MGFIFVAIGGAVGASLRHAATLLFARPGAEAFPWHTLGINALGAFALGALMALLPDGEASEPWRLLVGVGVLGGFTTFSTFSYEALGLAQQGRWLPAAGYTLGSVAAALAGVAIGYAAGRAL